MIYVPNLHVTAELAAWVAACRDHCRAHGYRVASVTDQWPAARDVLCSGLAQVLVVATRGHLDVARVPRMEVADEGGGEHRPRRLG